MNNRYYVLCVKRYDFKDDSGKRISGIKITYIDDTQIENSKDVKGQVPLSISCTDMMLWNQFTAVPHYYQLDFDIRAGAGNKPVLVLKGAKLLDIKAA